MAGDRRARSRRPPAAMGPGAPGVRRGQALLAGMSTRDKLAQLLMVGVTGAADARAVVDTHHVGGIMIGSWTDLSMLSDGSLDRHRRITGPLPLAVSVDEEGGRVSRLAGADRQPAVAAGAGGQQHARTRCTTSRCSAGRR